jgi:hypothetical protein
MAFKKLKTVEELVADRKTELEAIKDPRLFLKALRPSELCDLVEQFREDSRCTLKILDIVLWYNTRYSLSSGQRNVLEQFLLEVKFNVQ